MSNPTVLFVDDDLDRHAMFSSKFPYAKCVSTIKGAQHYLKSAAWEIVFLDHDLRNEKGTTLAEWCINEEIDVGHFVVHSTNAPYAMRMVRTLREKWDNVDYLPFTYAPGWNQWLIKR